MRVCVPGPCVHRDIFGVTLQGFFASLQRWSEEVRSVVAPHALRCLCVEMDAKSCEVL